MIKNIPAIYLIVCLFLFSCKPASREIVYGTDACQHCRMIISDQRYGTELVTAKGKIYTFDSIECLVRFMREHQTESSEAAFILVTDQSSPSKLVDAQSAFYLLSENLPSPMGEGLSAFESESVCDQRLHEYGGKKMLWSELFNVLP